MMENEDDGRYKEENMKTFCCAKCPLNSSSRFSEIYYIKLLRKQYYIFRSLIAKGTS